MMARLLLSTKRHSWWLFLQQANSGAGSLTVIVSGTHGCHLLSATTFAGDFHADEFWSYICWWRECSENMIIEGLFGPAWTFLCVRTHSSYVSGGLPSSCFTSLINTAERSSPNSPSTAWSGDTPFASVVILAITYEKHSCKSQASVAPIIAQ